MGSAYGLFPWDYLFLSVTHRSRNTWGGGVVGWWGIWIHPHFLLKNEFLTNCSLLETATFVNTTDWLQLSPFTAWKPYDLNLYFTVQNLKHVNLTATLELSLMF